MGTIFSSLWRTVRVVGPECVTLWRHRENGPSPWDTRTRRHHIWHASHNEWAQWIFENTGLTLRISGLDNFSHQEHFVITPNHASWIDVAAITAAFPSVFCFACKKDLLRWPLVGQVIRHGGQVVIDRKNRSQAINALSSGVHRALGSSVLIFPEGTRTTNGKLLPFKKGAFQAAQRSGLRILPVGIKGSFEALPKGPLWRLNTRVPIEVRFGCPILPNGKKTEDLLKETEETVRDLLSYP